MLTDRIIDDLKAALKGGDSLKVSTLRMVRSAIKNKEIEMRGRRVLAEQDVVDVVAKQVKNHQDSILAFEKGNRPDLAGKERAELAILKQYQPEPLSEEVVRETVSQILDESKETDFGKAMKLVMGKLEGRADGSTVAKLVGQYLGKT